MTDSPGVYGGRRSSSGATALPVIETASKGEIDVQSAWESGKPVYRFPSESRRESLAKHNARLSLQNLQERYGAAELEPSASALLSQNKENEDVVRFSTRAGMAEKALKSLQLEVDELRRKEIKHRQQKEELRTINKKLSTEMESMGMTLLEQTKTLRVLSSEIQRQDPCRLVRTKRGSAVGDLSIPPPAIVKEDDVAVEQLTKQNTELLRLLSALESGRDEGLVCTVELQVLSCEIEPHGTSLSAVKGDLTPRVVVKGPYSRAHMLIETSAPLSPSLSPTYTGSSRVGRWSALCVSECAHLHFDVLSALPDKPDLLLGKHDVSLNAVISAAQKDPSGASSLHGLPLRNEHGEETGTVYIEVKVLPAFQFSGADGQPHSRAHLIAGAPRRHTLMSPTPLSKHSTPPIEFFVQVLSASSLLERSPGVPSNPYVVVIDTGAQREVFRTSVCDGESRNPSWDGAHVVYNIADAYDAYLGDFVFRVYDHLGEGCEEDDFLGEATYKKAALSQSLKCTVSQLKLCPRPQEPIPYITKYRDHLGTIQVRLCNFTPSRNDDTRCPSTSVEQSLRRDESQPPRATAVRPCGGPTPCGTLRRALAPAYSTG
ncbi:C2 domain containing protein, putative [Angomonas deanei]|uniref:C2 domain containing protein, putative n=1 Tax=Angomonas deanei TaxID=59799 RepID=A0A7G2C3K2_9TRYP|nr:C2 domain containing protein, putative [Angomonas deanei]